MPELRLIDIDVEKLEVVGGFDRRRAEVMSLDSIEMTKTAVTGTKHFGSLIAVKRSSAIATAGETHGYIARALNPKKEE